jgi:hypothetical protein
MQADNNPSGYFFYDYGMTNANGRAIGGRTVHPATLFTPGGAPSAITLLFMPGTSFPLQRSPSHRQSSPALIL